VYQRAAQGDTRARTQNAIAAGVGLNDCAPQAMQAGLERAGTDGGLTGFDLREGCRAASCWPRSRRGSRGAHRRFKRCAGLHAELTLEQVPARCSLARGANAVACSRKAADKQGLVVLIKRIFLHQPCGQISRFSCRTCSQPGQRSLAQHGLRDRLQVATLGCKPNFKRRAACKTHPFEQFAAQVRHTQSLRPSCQPHHVDINIACRLQRERQHVPSQIRMAQHASEFTQIPAQRAQRIICVLKQQVSKLRAARRAFAANQVGQQAPHLATTRCRQRPATTLDAGYAKQVNRQALA